MEKSKKNRIGLNYAAAEDILAELSGLIEFYGNKSNDEEIKSDLRLFLWELISAGKAISRRYLAVAIRNEFIKLSKKRQEQRIRENMLYDNLHTENNNIEERLDLIDALKKLTDKQRETVVLHHIAGLSFTEIAKRQGTSRQAAQKTAKRAEERLKEVI